MRILQGDCREVMRGMDAESVDCDPDYIEMAKRRVTGDAPLFAEVA